MSLYKAYEAELSNERQRYIVDAIERLEAIGDPALAPMIARLCEASCNVSDNAILQVYEEQLRAMAEVSSPVAEAA